MTEDPARYPRQTVLFQDVTDTFDETRFGGAGSA
jgi:hypothetical protein